MPLAILLLASGKKYGLFLDGKVTLMLASLYFSSEERVRVQKDRSFFANVEVVKVPCPVLSSEEARRFSHTIA